MKCFFLILISCYCECDDTHMDQTCTLTHVWVCVCVCVSATCVCSIEWFVHMIIVTSCWMCLLSVSLTLFMRDNTVWIELMHFALKSSSIWIWSEERVSGRMNVSWIYEWQKKRKTAQLILSFNVFILFLYLGRAESVSSCMIFYSSLLLIYLIRRGTKLQILFWCYFK